MPFGTLRTFLICAAICALLRAEIPAGPDELSFDVVVRDKKGKPVQNLEPGDLKVWDNGAPVKLTRLDFVSGAAGKHLIAMVFDRMDPTSAKDARAAADKLLKMPESSNIDFAVFKIVGRLQLYQNATRDRDLLRKAIRSSDQAVSAEKELTAEVRTGSDASGKRLSAEDRQEAQAMLSALVESQQISRNQHVHSPLGALMALVRAEQKLAGRKAILFFTPSVRMDTSVRELVKTIVGLANRAGVSIYVISASSSEGQDGGALMASMAVGTQSSASQSGIAAAGPGPALPSTFPVEGVGATSMGTEQMGRMETSGLDEKQNPMADLCVSTAGRYLGNGGDLKFAFRQMIGDLTNYYKASYVAPAMQYDGQFRRLQIRAVRKKLRIQARTGYLALPAAMPIGTKPFEIALQNVLRQQQLPTGIDFRSAVMQVGDQATTNALVVEIPFRDLVLAEDENTKLFSLHVSMLAQIKDQAGTVIESFSEDLPMRGAKEAKDRMRQEIATVERHFDAPPGEYTLEVAIQDRNAGKASAQRRTFQVAKEPASAYLSDVALVRRTEAFRSDSDTDDPLQYRGNRVVPSIENTIGSDEKDISFFFVIHPAAKSATQPKLEMEVRKDGQAVGRGLLALRQSEGGKPLAYMATLKASAFGPGSYTAAAILTQDGKTVEQVRAFQVPGPQIASTAGPVIAAPKTVLTITPATGALSKPPDEMLSVLLSAAKARAVDYTDNLPNVSCVEVTDRSVDASGVGAFQHQDTIEELVRYHDKTEQRVMLRLNNEPAKGDRMDLKGTISHGEFGGLLTSIFSADSNAEFTWQEKDVLGPDAVQVFAYAVAQKNSTLGVEAGNGDYAKPGFHGLVYVDEFTHAVRRLTLESDELAPEFPTHSVKFVVDYDYIAIGDHDYLLPVTGSMRVEKGRHMVVLNEFEFRDYKRYVAQSSVKY